MTVELAAERRAIVRAAGEPLVELFKQLLGQDVVGRDEEQLSLHLHAGVFGCKPAVGAKVVSDMRQADDYVLDHHVQKRHHLLVLGVL